jgi:predicted RNA-binding Zn-ribbon protein involved in translation (DUF1610 family)
MSEHPLCSASDCAQQLAGEDYVLAMEQPRSGQVLYQCPRCGELTVAVFDAGVVEV